MIKDHKRVKLSIEKDNNLFSGPMDIIFKDARSTRELWLYKNVDIFQNFINSNNKFLHGLFSKDSLESDYVRKLGNCLIEETNKLVDALEKDLKVITPEKGLGFMWIRDDRAIIGITNITFSDCHNTRNVEFYAMHKEAGNKEILYREDSRFSNFSVCNYIFLCALAYIDTVTYEGMLEAKNYFISSINKLLKDLFSTFDKIYDIGKELAIQARKL